MYTFIGGLILLVLGYLIYGRYVERVFGVKKDRPTPAYTSSDGVDYVPMNTGKNSLIQLLNIAGVGPIFGPIMGALYGPVAFVWIVIGAIFAGGVHDYLTGMISIRNRGAHLPELAARFFGNFMKHVVNLFALLLLVLVGTVFVSAPADLLNNLFKGGEYGGAIFAAIIFIYYILATLLPIDKIIGRFYPFFGVLLVISAVGVGAGLIITGEEIPELTLQNLHPENTPIFPLLFLTISCGALSGFHATQSPIISRTTQSEGAGRKIFYGMMIAEGAIAMIWAAAAMSMFHGEDLSELLANGGPAVIVSKVATTMLGGIGGTLAILGVIILPITSGDTSFRSARMIIADYFKIPQEKIGSRLGIALPMFVISAILLQIDFNLLWRYFSWANQSTAVIALFVGAMYLYIAGRNYWIALIPGAFMLMVTTTYILNASIGFGIAMLPAQILAAILSLVIITLFFLAARRAKAANCVLDDDVSHFKAVGEGQ